ncbi:glutathione S-transferase [Escherichia coli]|nr:glutathione S-transferase [Escherichia coli]
MCFLSTCGETSVTNGAIVIHTQRLKSDPGGNLLS